jgi:ubiquinone/menaquinone biosynthesis C-methylase UbiE
MKIATLRSGARALAGPLRGVAKPLRGLASVTHDARTGSSYEDYDATSKTYDSFRLPISLDIFRQAFADTAVRVSKPIQTLDLLDGGCGSGNYLHALKGDVGSIHGLEFNEGMLSKAKEKEGLSNEVLTQGSITEMPFEDASFDVVITTQVLHHLERGGGADFTNVGLACAEVCRCLRPGGAWLIQTQTPQQHVDGFWWAPVIPNAAQTLAKHFPTLPKLEALCRSAGFSDFTSVIPPEPLVRIDAYLGESIAVWSSAPRTRVARARACGLHSGHALNHSLRLPPSLCVCARAQTSRGPSSRRSATPTALGLSPLSRSWRRASVCSVRRLRLERPRRGWLSARRCGRRWARRLRSLRPSRCEHPPTPPSRCEHPPTPRRKRWPRCHVCTRLRPHGLRLHALSNGLYAGTRHDSLYLPVTTAGARRTPIIRYAGCRLVGVDPACMTAHECCVES